MSKSDLVFQKSPIVMKLYSRVVSGQPIRKKLE